MQRLFILVYFSNSILFPRISVISFNFCSILSWLLLRDILRAKWKSWHQCYIIKVIILKVTISTASAMALALPKFYFSLIIFFWKKQDIYIWYNSIFFLLFSYSASISLWYNYLFLCNFLLIHSEASFGVLEKRMFEFSKATVHYRFGKIRKSTGKSFGNFLVKHPYWRPF